jgi:peroxiredoxin
VPPSEGDPVPAFEALLCTGETFRSRRLTDALDGGGVIVFFGFAFNAIAENWWKRYEYADWDAFDVPVVGVSRDGPYAQNAFIRYLDSPFHMFSDTDGAATRAFGLLTEREAMAGTSTARRAVFVVDGAGTVTHRWVADDWVSPVPREDIEAAVAAL